MGGLAWPSDAELNEIREVVSHMAGTDKSGVQVVVSPYRICPLGAHIDHQGGTVSAMTINKGILLGFVPSSNRQVVIRSAQFKGEVNFSVDEIQQPRQNLKTNKENQAKDCSVLKEQCNWGRYARGAVYALQSGGNNLFQGIIGYIRGSDALDSSGLSSSAAAKEHKLIHQSPMEENQSELRKATKILLAVSGLKQALTSNPGYNRRVAECQEAAKILLQASGDFEAEPILSNVDPQVYEAHKCKLEPNLAKRAEHYFSENMRVTKGLEAWALGNLVEFGTLVSASGLSSIQNYECGAEPMIQLYEILLRAPGVLGARFSGAGFRGCCIALVEADLATEAASFVRREYLKVQPELASRISDDSAVLICEPGDCARVI